MVSKTNLLKQLIQVRAPLPGGRSKAPIWAFYIVDDIKMKEGVLCQVNVAGGVCPKKLLQNESTSSGLMKINSVEKSHKKHVPGWVEGVISF